MVKVIDFGSDTISVRSNCDDAVIDQECGISASVEFHDLHIVKSESRTARELKKDDEEWMTVEFDKCR